MIWAFFVLATLVVAWFVFIRPAFRRFSDITGLGTMIEHQGASLWPRIRLRLEGMKTTLLGFASIGFGVVPDLLQELRLIDFTPFFNPDIAAKIMTGIALLMVVTHARGLAKAAAIEPRKEDQP